MRKKTQRITKRNMDCYLPFLSGKPVKEIAQDLGLSERTVYQHIEIVQRLAPHEHVEAAKTALKSISLDAVKVVVDALEQGDVKTALRVLTGVQALVDRQETADVPPQVSDRDEGQAVVDAAERIIAQRARQVALVNKPGTGGHCGSNNDKK